MGLPTAWTLALYLVLLSLLTKIGVAIHCNSTPSVSPSEYIFNLGFPKSASSSFYEYLQCHRRAELLSPPHLVSHYLCGRKDIFASREFQTCGECIQRAARSHRLNPPSTTAPTLSLEESCSGAKAYTQMDYANVTQCAFPQIENLEYLLEMHTEAKFVLLTRPVKHWLTSVDHFFDLKSRLVACLKRQPSLFPPYDAMSPAAKKVYFRDEGSLLMDWYQWHNRYVVRLFRRRNLQHLLLVLDIEDSIVSVQTRLNQFLGLALAPSFSPDTSTDAGTRGGSEREVGVNCWGHSNKNTEARLHI
jgi:hypothetical protein